MHSRRISLLALAVGALAASLAPGALAGASGNGVANQSPVQIVNAAVHASLSANSFTVTGSIGQGAQRVGLNLSLSATKVAQGSITAMGQTINLIQIGNTIYFKASTSFWTQNGGATAAQLFANKWVSGPASSSDFSSFSQFLDPHQLANQFFQAPTGTDFHKGKTSTVNGQKVIAITGTDKSGGGKGVLYVATTGKPYVVKVTVKGGSSGSGSVSFSNYNKPVHASAPKNSLNLSQLKG
jgi:hypothetical protein